MIYNASCRINSRLFRIKSGCLGDDGAGPGWYAPDVGAFTP